MLEYLLANPWTALVAVLIGGIALIAGGEWLVRGASSVALGLRISPLVVGLTIVALCTSAPEMAVSFSSVLRAGAEGANDVADVAIGNVVGSNICNILLILGCCAMIRPLKAQELIVKRDFPVYVVIALATCALAFPFVNENGDRYFPQWLGIVFLLAFVAYEIVAIKQARRDENAAHMANVVDVVVPDAVPQGLSEPLREVAKKSQGAAVATTPEVAQDRAPVKTNWALAILQILIGLVALVGGARYFVDGPVTVARALGVSELVIGLTLVALGTSLPELTVSAVATYRNQIDVALGNVVGSCICNVVLILGGTLLLAPGGLALKTQTVFVDIPVMLVSGAIAAWFCLTDRKLERWEGAVLLLMQAGYAFYLVKFA